MNGIVKSAARILDILELFALSREPLALRDISGALDIPKSSTLMLLRTLESRGYVMRGDDDRYRLDPVWRPDGAVGDDWLGGRTMRLIRVADPIMRELVDTLEETTVLGVLTPESDVRVVASVVSPLAVRYDLTRMSVIPTYCTALGHAMLAYQAEEVIEHYIDRCSFEAITEKTIVDPAVFRAQLSKVRQRGWAINSEERFLGASGVAAPIFDAHGDVVAALNVATLTVRFRRNQKRILASVKEAAARLSSLAEVSSGKTETIAAAASERVGR
ncbi:MAG: IclR family transcriptional regulator [Alphaproteobacteria bacterium]|nr:IclR family transcriptional regulator [Alphaproteobacteria bacterium]